MIAETRTWSAQVQFILTGFAEEMGFRVFSFERMGEGPNTDEMYGQSGSGSDSKLWHPAAGAAVNVAGNPGAR